MWSCELGCELGWAGAGLSYAPQRWTWVGAPSLHTPLQAQQACHYQSPDHNAASPLLPRQARGQRWPSHWACQCCCPPSMCQTAAWW